MGHGPGSDRARVPVGRGRAVAVHRYGIWQRRIKPKLLRAPFELLYRILYLLLILFNDPILQEVVIGADELLALTGQNVAIFERAAR